MMKIKSALLILLLSLGATNLVSESVASASPEATLGADAKSVPIVGLRANGGAMTSFNEAAGLDLSFNDYAKFVDPHVQGRDRQLAIALLRVMPRNMRGDFVYINKYSRIISNRPEIGFSVRALAPGFVRSLKKNRSVSASRMATPQTRLAGSSVMSYPPTGGTGGAFIRAYSQQNINAALAYAQPPCDFSLRSGESGNMYINAYDSNGSDVIDAGVGTGISASTGLGGNGSPGLGNVVAFTTPGQGGWTNQSQTYPCGRAVGIMYGTLPPTISNQLSYLATGVPDYDPSQFNLPPSSTYWQPASWTFFDTNTALLMNPTTWNGYASNCAGCSIARMTTIGQNGYVGVNYDGSCYGYCSSAGADAFWRQSVAGELVPPCQNEVNTSQCTIAWTANWEAGEIDSGQGIGYSEQNNQTAASGINLNGLLSTNRSVQALTTPTTAAPASSCPPDSQNLCATVTSTSPNGSCVFQGPSHPIARNGLIKRYGVFIGPVPMKEISSTSYTTQAYVDDTGTCQLIVVGWSPWEPRVQYNDPSLP